MREPWPERFSSKTQVQATGCIEWIASRDGCGYGMFRFGGRSQRAHRVAWILTFGGIPDGLQVLHKCDNPPCVNPDHLFLGTNHDNVLDAVAKGRHGGRGEKHWTHTNPDAVKRGERHWMRRRPDLVRWGEDAFNARLSDAEVDAIRARYAAGGITQTALADEFGVHQTTISLIVNRRMR